MFINLYHILTLCILIHELHAIVPTISSTQADDHVETASPTVADDHVQTVSPTLAADHVQTVSPTLADDHVQTVSPTLADDHVKTVSPTLAADHVQTVSPTLAGDQSINITQMMIEAKIIPEMIRHAPYQLCRVFYKQGEVKPGEALEYNKIIYPPLVTWDAEPNSTYFLYFACVQRYVPRKKYVPFKLYIFETTPIHGAIHTYQLWAVSNIPGRDIVKGKTLIHYEGPGPSRGPAADERFVFLVYKQASPNVQITDVKGIKWGYYNVPAVDNISHIERKFKIGRLVAGNFFRLVSKNHTF